MPITTNSGGVLHTLSPIYVNNSGVLNELSTVYANTGGVLSTIYEKDSGGGGDDPTPVDPTRTETFHWGNYTGTANTTPVCIGNFTIDESMNCTYKDANYFSITDHSPIPTDSMIPSNYDKLSTMSCYYDYYSNTYIKKSMDVNDSNYVSWESKGGRKYVEYNRDTTGKWTMGAKGLLNGSVVTTPKLLEKGTYYVYFSNYIKCYFNQSGKNDVLIKYMPWDNMSADVTLTLKPIT